MHQKKTYSIKVLGSFDLLNVVGASVRPSGKKDCALLAMLALTRNHRQTRTWLQEKLWGDRGPAQGAASLRQSLSTLRSALNGNFEVLKADRTWIWLDPEHFDFDHKSSEADGEVLRGFDLREEGFNDWLRDTRSEHCARSARWGQIGIPAQPDRLWFIEMPVAKHNDETLTHVGEMLCDRLTEALAVVGVHAVVDRRSGIEGLTPRATDYRVRTRVLRVGTACILSLSVTDGFGSLVWQLRRETDANRWLELQAILVEFTELFQDFVIRAEAQTVRGAQWSSHANGCQALMGIIAPGTVPLGEITAFSEAAISANEKGIYHALLGFARLLQFGERQPVEALDADVIMNSFRTALSMSPTNGLVQALAGHSYGFLLHDLDRNASMTAEAVRLLPGSGACWNFHAVSLAYCGKFAEAVSAAETAVHLCKGTLAHPLALSTECFASLMAGDTEKAIRSGEASLDANFFRPTVIDLMTAYAKEDRRVEGCETLRLLTHREPELCVELLQSPDYPIVNSIHRAEIVGAASVLGLQ